MQMEDTEPVRPARVPQPSVAELYATQQSHHRSGVR